MTYLADANVLSEPTKPKPDAKVMAWLREHERDLVVDPIVLGEIRFGIYLLPAGKRRRALERWFEDGIHRLTCLPWDTETAMCWAKLLASLRRSGKAMPIKDSLIAATALAHGVSVATRNETDFKRAQVRVFNPFS